MSTQGIFLEYQSGGTSCRSTSGRQLTEPPPELTNKLAFDSLITSSLSPITEELY